MPLTTHIKRLIYPLYIWPRVTGSKKIRMHRLFEAVGKGTAADPISPLRVFSNHEEDGIILYLLARLQIREGYFVDLGSNDCINSNCANLVFTFHWKGLFIDANAALLRIGERNYRFFGKGRGLQFVRAFLEETTVEALLKQHLQGREVDFMSLDIDGNDYAIWRGLHSIRPKLLVIENKIEYGARDIVVPPSPDTPPERWGASLTSMVRLGREKGYTLVACNHEGFNAFFVRDDLLGKSGLKPLDPETVLQQDHIRQGFFAD